MQGTDVTYNQTEPMQNSVATTNVTENRTQTFKTVRKTLTQQKIKKNTNKIIHRIQKNT